MDTVPTCFVAGGSNDSPGFRTSYHNGFSPVFRMVALFDGCIKGVHIDMDNFSVVHVGRYEGNRLYVIPEEETGISFFYSILHQLARLSHSPFLPY